MNHRLYNNLFDLNHKSLSLIFFKLSGDHKTDVGLGSFNSILALAKDIFLKYFSNIKNNLS